MCSGPEEARNVREDPGSILHSVVETRLKQLSGSVKAARATTGTSQRSHWVCSGVVFQLQQWMQVELGEKSSGIVEEMIDGSVPPMAESYVRCTVALIVGKVAAAHVERQLSDVLTAPD